MPHPCKIGLSMGHNKAAACGHNKKSSPYKSPKRNMKIDQSRQQTLIKFFKNACTVDQKDQARSSAQKHNHESGTVNDTYSPIYRHQDKVSYKKVNGETNFAVEKEHMISAMAASILKLKIFKMHINLPNGFKRIQANKLHQNPVLTIAGHKKLERFVDTMYNINIK